MAIEYFSDKEYSNCFNWEHTGYFGKNGVLYGNMAIDFWQAYEKYPLGFKDIEDFYYNMEHEQERKDFEYFLKDSERRYSFNMDEAMEYLDNEKSGYYAMYPAGLDFNWSDLEEELLKKGIFKNIEVKI